MIGVPAPPTHPGPAPGAHGGSGARAAPESSVISTAGRRGAAAIAVIAWVALALQLVVTITLLTADGRTVTEAIWRYLGFFTILTNLLVAVTLTRVALGRWPGGSAPDISAITGVVLAIAIVGVNYHVLLSGRVPEMGPLWWTADRMLHYLVPTASVAWWMASVPKSRLRFNDPPTWLVYPVSYLGYALVRGAFDGWYPYYFLDVGAIGYARALTNAAALTVAMLVAGYAVVAGVKALQRA